MADFTGNRPFGKLDAQGRTIPAFFEALAYQADYTGVTTVYKGFARPGTSVAAAKWQIFRETRDGSNNVTVIAWPHDSAGHASNEFQFIWNNRAALTYS